MTNFEKYKDEIEKLKNKYSFTLDLDGNVVDCNDILCRNCKFHFRTCKNSKINWLFDEYKEPVLTNDDFEFIKVLEKIKKTKYKFIAKSLSGHVTFFTRKPSIISSQSARTGDYYYYTGRKNYAVFFEDTNNLFQGIKSKDGLYDIENKCFIKE